MGRKRSLFWTAAGTAILLTVLAGLAAREAPLRAGLPEPPGDSTLDESLAPRADEPPDRGSRSPSVAIGERRPESLAGTEVDGALVVDASGAFVATPDAIDLFDYYLSAVGEEPFERIVARIEAAIRARLDPPDAGLALLHRYLAYREAVRRMVEVEGLEAWPLERRLQRLRESRRSFFGAELAEALFAEEEDRSRNALAWRRVAADPALDPRERADRLAALEAEWPEAERKRWARATVAARTLDRESELREQGASEAEIQVLREREFGVEAAARLAALDRSRGAWAARVAHYRDERERIEADEFVGPAEAAAEIAALRSRLFEGPELLRIRALDEVERGRRDVR